VWARLLTKRKPIISDLCIRDEFFPDPGCRVYFLVRFSYNILRIVFLLSFQLIIIAPETVRSKKLVGFISLLLCTGIVGSGIRNEKFKDLDPGSGMKNFGLRDPQNWVPEPVHKMGRQSMLILL
jgi:hypothetical protein